MVVVRALQIGRDVHVLHPEFSMNEIAIAIDQASFAHADGFDFRTRKDNTCGEDVDELVVERGSFVLYVDALWLLVFFHLF